MTGFWMKKSGLGCGTSMVTQTEIFCYAGSTKALKMLIRMLIVPCYTASLVLLVLAAFRTQRRAKEASSLLERMAPQRRTQKGRRKRKRTRNVRPYVSTTDVLAESGSSDGGRCNCSRFHRPLSTFS